MRNRGSGDSYSLYKCKMCLDIRTKRCQRDLSVPSSKCRRRHNILYTHIIHFVYPRSASAFIPLLHGIHCDHILFSVSFIFIKKHFFSSLFLLFVFGCRRRSLTGKFLSILTRNVNGTKWLRHCASDSLTLVAHVRVEAKQEQVPTMFHLHHRRIFIVVLLCRTCSCARVRVYL